MFIQWVDNLVTDTRYRILQDNRFPRVTQKTHTPVRLNELVMNIRRVFIAILSGNLLTSCTEVFSDLA